MVAYAWGPQDEQARDTHDAAAFTTSPQIYQPIFNQE